VLAVAPAARHVAFADAGHLIHLDQFERYLEVIAGFLAEHGGA
jgi:hypothetical protein